MPFTPRTAVGDLTTFIARAAESATDASGVQVRYESDVGVPISISITGDASAATNEVAGALLAHLLEETRHPLVRAFLLDAIARIGIDL